VLELPRVDAEHDPANIEMNCDTRPGEALVLRELREPVRFIVQTRLRTVSIMPGMLIAAPDLTETRSGSSVAEILLRRALDRRERLLD